MAEARRARTHVQQFRYRTLTPAPGTAAEEDSGAAGLMLTANFDPGAVDALLRDAGLSVWSRTRPSTLVWLAVEGQSGRYLVGADDPAGLSAALLAGAAQRGVPLVLPLLDLEDRSSLGVTDVFGGFKDTVLAASHRYASDAVLVGRVHRVLSDLWEARWSLYLDGTAHDWQTRGNLPELATEAAVHELADRLALRFTRPAVDAAPARIELMVIGVESLEDYARALGYLRSLDVVSKVYVNGVDRDQVVFQLAAPGGRETVEQVISLGRIFTPTASIDRLTYRLLP